LNNVQTKHKVTYDTSLKTTFIVHMSCVFTPSKKGLRFSDVKGNIAHVIIGTDSIKSKYTFKEYTDAHKAQAIQNTIDLTSANDYIKYVEKNLIPSWPITKAEIVHAENIFGSNLGSLKARHEKKNPERVILNKCKILPKGMLDEHGNMTLDIDIMYINKIPFMMTTSNWIDFGIG